ncbi:TPA: hypothetical protein R5E59_002409 [Enterobacter cloacae]|nr:hypothetical protein [Enterobacter cloacae]
MLDEILVGSQQDTEINLVYIVSYDLTNAANEYAKINAILEDAGYSRDTSLGVDTIPENVFAGEKLQSHRPGEEATLLNKESSRFLAEVIEIIDKEAPGKRKRLFVSVSKKDATSYRLE